MLRLRCYVLILTGLLLLALVMPFVVQNASAEVSFIDNFNDGNAEGWTAQLGSWSVVNEAYFISVGIVENGISTVNEPIPSDSVIETKLVFTDNVGFRAGVVFRYTDNGHYYAFELSNEYDCGCLIKYIPSDTGYGEVIAAVDNYVIQQGIEYRLKVIIQGNYFRCFVNDFEVLSTTDDTYSYGKVGLRARRAGVFFDDFEISTATTPTFMFRDEFRQETLDNRWILIDPDGGSTFELNENPDWLRITTTQPPYRDLYTPVDTNAPRVLIQGQTGDFTVETKIMANTDQEWESGGILIWKDESNFVRLDRACGMSNSQRILFAITENGASWTDASDVVLASNLNPTYLKMTRSGNIYSAYYSVDGKIWIYIDDKTFSPAEPLGVGLDVVNVYNEARTFFADFDYFKMESELASSFSLTSLVSDDFSNIDSWTMNIEGAWLTSGGILQGWAPETSGSWVLRGDTSWINYKVTARIRLVSGSEATLIVRYRDDSNFYYLGLGSWNSKYSISKVEGVGANVTKLASTGLGSEVELGRWYTVSAIVEGNTLQMFVDGCKVLEVQDDTHPNGAVGLRTWNGTMQADYIVVQTWSSDDFSSDSGMWEYLGSAYRDPVNEYLVLTEATNNQGGVAFFNIPFTSVFTASFRYKAGGGSGGDGFVMFFYKQKYSTVGNGGGLGFNSEEIVPGYGVEFDNWQNIGEGPPGEHADPSPNHIALIKDHVGNHLTYVNDVRTGDNNWHDVSIVGYESAVEVFVDGGLVLQWNGELDRTYDWLGFSAATGSATNWHIIDDFSIVFSAEHEPTPPTTGDLVGHWKLNEESGTFACDSSGYGNNGSLVGEPIWVDGVDGKALQLDGIDDYVLIPDSPSLRVQSFTLSAWIYMTKRPYQHGSRHSAIINKLYFQISGINNRGYKLQFDDPTSTDDNLVVTIGDGTSQKYLVKYNSISDLTLNAWHCIVGTWNGSVASIYIDGELKNSANTGTYVIEHDSTPLALGTEVTSGAKDVWFKGIIDEAMIYAKALTAKEIYALYESVPTLPEPTLELSCKSSTSYSGFKVEMQGNLKVNETAIAEAPVLLSYSVTGGNSWEDLTMVYTAPDGSYSAIWMPSVTGSYLIKATYEEDETYLGTATIVTLAVTPYGENNIFSVSSNSTVTSLVFDSERNKLKFSVSGESGTTGYADVCIAKTLVQDPSTMRVFLDEEELNCTCTSTEDAWLLHFTYTHSTHNIVVDLESAIIPDFTGWLFLPFLILITLLGFIIRKKLNKYQ